MNKMAYAFDYHLARGNKEGIRDKLEKETFDLQEYRFYRKRVYAMTKWFMQNRHREGYSKKIPDGVSYPVSQDVFDAFDSWVSVVMNTLKMDDRVDALTVDIDHGECGYTDHTNEVDHNDHVDRSCTLHDMNRTMVPKKLVPIDKMLGVRRDKGRNTTNMAYPQVKQIHLRDHKYRNKRIPSLNLTNTHEDTAK